MCRRGSVAALPDHWAFHASTDRPFARACFALLVRVGANLRRQSGCRTDSRLGRTGDQSRTRFRRLSALGRFAGEAALRRRWRHLYPLRTKSRQARRSRDGRHQPFASRSHLGPRRPDVGQQPHAERAAPDCRPLRQYRCAGPCDVPRTLVRRENRGLSGARFELSAPNSPVPSARASISVSSMSAKPSRRRCLTATGCG